MKRASIPIQATTRLLLEASQGNSEAVRDLLPLVYEELRARAAEFFRRQRPGHTLQPTALVHEAYLRLVDQRQAGWKDRAHFIAVAVKAMRQILIDHHRRRQAAKRGGEWGKVTLAQVNPVEPAPQLDFLALAEALTKLEALDRRQAEMVSLRFFGGLKVEEVAEILGVSTTTVEGEWRAARAWLARELRKGDGGR